MATRGKRLTVAWRFGDGTTETLTLAAVRLQQLEGAARVLADPACGARLRKEAKDTLRQAAEAWALHDRDRSNQVARSVGGKLTEAQRDRIRMQYAQRVRDGEKWGAIGALAREFGVSDKTISAILRAPGKRVRK